MARFINRVVIILALMALIPTGLCYSQGEYKNGTKINCRKVVFHPYCRGISALRAESTHEATLDQKVEAIQLASNIGFNRTQYKSHQAFKMALLKKLSKNKNN